MNDTIFIKPSNLKPSAWNAFIIHLGCVLMSSFNVGIFYIFFLGNIRCLPAKYNEPAVRVSLTKALKIFPQMPQILPRISQKKCGAARSALKNLRNLREKIRHQLSH